MLLLEICRHLLKRKSTFLAHLTSTGSISIVPHNLHVFGTLLATFTCITTDTFLIYRLFKSFPYSVFLNNFVSILIQWKPCFTATSLLRPLYLAARKNDHTFNTVTSLLGPIFLAQLSKNTLKRNVNVQS